MESLLHYVWQNRLFYPSNIVSDAGEPVEIINPGVHNTDAGPDFRCAVVKIGDTQWVGNVEIHIDGEDWYRHNHHTDREYTNVTLHVVTVPSRRKPMDMNGRVVPEIVLRYPKEMDETYEWLTTSAFDIRCKGIIPELTQLERDSWLDRLLIERMQQRSERVVMIHEESGGDWEQTLFIMLARAIGQGVNSDGMQDVARRSLLKIAQKLSSVEQIEALLFGRAGLLEREEGDEYYKKLRREYELLRVRFELSELQTKISLKMLRLRPKSFPTIRIAQLSAIIFASQGNLSVRFGTLNLKELSRALTVKASEYWDNHYDFGKEEKSREEKWLGGNTKMLMLINGVVPWLYARARKMGREREEENILKMLEFMKAEKNHLIESWKRVGLSPQNEAEACALIHLSKNYCAPRKCLLCRFGQKMLTIKGA